MTTQQQQRMETFKKVCDVWLGEVPTKRDHYNTTAAEDAAAIIYGDDPELPRYVLVTIAGEQRYLYPVDGTAAANEKCEYVADDCFGEGPLRVVDLDNGDEYVPVWEGLRWTKAAS